MPCWPSSALLSDDPLLIQSPGLGTLTSVASTDTIRGGMRSSALATESQVWPGNWTLVMRHGLHVNHLEIAMCLQAVSCGGFMAVRAITSRPPSCTCNNLTTFYGLNSRNYIIYAHFSFSNIFPLLLKPTNLTFSNKLAVSRQIKIKCGLRMCGF